MNRALHRALAGASAAVALLSASAAQAGPVTFPMLEVSPAWTSNNLGPHYAGVAVRSTGEYINRLGVIDANDDCTLALTHHVSLFALPDGSIGAGPQTATFIAAVDVTPGTVAENAGARSAFFADIPFLFLPPGDYWIAVNAGDGFEGYNLGALGARTFQATPLQGWEASGGPVPDGSAITVDLESGDVDVSWMTGLWGVTASQGLSFLGTLNACSFEDGDSDGVDQRFEVCFGFDDNVDSDLDTSPDGCDACPGFDDNLDADGDFVPNGCDVCPGFNDNLDSDGDFVPDCLDVCIGGDDTIDSDLDTVPDACDVCPSADDRLDADGDTFPDACDTCPGGDDRFDADLDFVPDDCDQCPGLLDFQVPPFDADSDGIFDACDVCPGVDDRLDTDGDLTPDCTDVCPADPTKDTFLLCPCGVPDTDSDGDAFPDCFDLCPLEASVNDVNEDGCEDILVQRVSGTGFLTCTGGKGSGDGWFTLDAAWSTLQTAPASAVNGTGTWTESTSVATFQVRAGGVTSDRWFDSAFGPSALTTYTLTSNDQAPGIGSGWSVVGAGPGVSAFFLEQNYTTGLDYFTHNGDRLPPTRVFAPYALIGNAMTWDVGGGDTCTLDILATYFFDDADADYVPDVSDLCEYRAGRVDLDSDGCPDDADSDGFGNDLDCDDAEPLAFPGASELPGDEIDSDCDGGELCWVDFDGDLQAINDVIASSDADCADAPEQTSAALSPGPDCDDGDPTRYVGNTELAGSGVDEDCDGLELCAADVDLDGFAGPPITTSNLNCDGVAELTPTAPIDCDDNNASVTSGPELPNDGVDSNCDGFELCALDIDQDGFFDPAGDSVPWPDLTCNGPGLWLAPGGGPEPDCDDGNSGVFPGAPESPGDEIDGDCDGGELCWTDLDSDGAVGTTPVVSSDVDCADPGELTEAFRLSAGAPDCDDLAPATAPSQPEIPGDGVDNDCDGLEICGQDDDGDGTIAGTVLSPFLDCSATGLTSPFAPADCYDLDALISPLAFEFPNDGVDSDCDTFELCAEDLDTDGWAGGTFRVSASLLCAEPTLWAGVTPGLDCQDNDAAQNPGAVDAPGDGWDADCDTVELCSFDLDNDGERSASPSPVSVPAPDGPVWPNAPVLCSDLSAGPPGGDCDDNNPLVRSTAAELPGDSVDSDCDGAEVCFADLDDDGFRPTTIDTVASADADCADAGEATSADPAGDCDDADPAVFPGQGPDCDDIDGDGILNGVDACPNTPAGPIDADADGCPDDTDADGVVDATDACPLIAAGPFDVDADGCPDDRDADGVPDAADLCPDTPALIDVDADGCPDPGVDSDGDGIDDAVDVCFGDNTTGDADGDGLCTDSDLCLGDNSTGDTDADGICEDLDLCVGDDGLSDPDGDGICGLCPDADSDGVCDADDLCTGDDAVGDADADGVCDDLDSCSGDDGSGDADADGFCAVEDCDDTNNQIYPGAPETCDGLDNDCDGSPLLEERDLNGNGIPDCVCTSTPCKHGEFVDDQGSFYCGVAGGAGANATWALSLTAAVLSRRWRRKSAA